MARKRRNSKSATKPSILGNGKPLGKSRGVMPKPSVKFPNHKALANKRACRTFTY